MHPVNGHVIISSIYTTLNYYSFQPNSILCYTTPNFWHTSSATLLDDQIGASEGVRTARKGRMASIAESRNNRNTKNWIR